MNSLRQEIEQFLKETYMLGNCVPHENIVTRRLLKIIVKRIDVIWESKEIKYGNQQGQAALELYGKIKKELLK